MAEVRFSSDKYLMISIAAAMFMITFDAEIWAGVLSFIFFFYQILVDKKLSPAISRKIVSLMALIAVVLVYFKFKTLLGKEPSSTVFLIITGLKILDLRTKSDKQFLILLGFSLLALRPLFSVDLYWIPPIGLSFIGFWMSLFELKNKRSPKYLFKILLTSLPLSILMFFTFPRVVLPWANDKSVKKAVMGFANQINPGSVSELLQRDELAFRVQFFDNYVPKRKDLYWRGGVLAISKGFSWYPLLNDPKINNVSMNDSKVRYQVLIEPDLEKIMFGLDRPVKIFSPQLDVKRSGSGVFTSVNEINNSTLYEMSSDLEYEEVTDLDDEARNIYLQNPPLSDRIQNLVKNISEKTKTDDEKIKILQEYFSEGGFRYTPTPGDYSNDALDEFLFVRKKGFCEHFAASFATLSRALGIPSRVIVGFQGGTYNEIGKYWKITSQDAHAWSEIYIHGVWKRVDPTAWVSRLRTEMDSNIYYSLEDEERASATHASKIGLKQKLLLLADNILNVFDMLNYKWNKFLIEFDQSSQKEIFKEILLNLTFWRVIILLFFMYAYYVLSRKALEIEAKVKPYTRLFQDICAWAAEKRMERSPSETPIQFLNRVKANFPSLQEYIQLFQENYESEAYVESPSYKVVRRLRKQLKKGFKSVNSIERRN